MISLNDQIANCVYLNCKLCGEEKQRIEIGMYPDGRDRKYMDADGRPWNGHVCGKCDNDCKKIAQKKRRALRKIVNQKRRERYARSKQPDGRTDDPSST